LPEPYAPVTLVGSEIRLLPLEPHHAPAFVAAAAGDRSLYCWTFVPHDLAGAAAYIQTALEWQQAGTAVPFAIVRLADGVVIGSTRYFKMEQWEWPEGHERHGRSAPDVCEIGYTWLAGSAIRTAANTEAKFLMLRYAFEQWRVLRVSLQTDVRNLRSQAAIERLGAKREGVLRAQRLGADNIARDSVRYSIVASEWPEVRGRLQQFLER
jgi:RimJ/RimL family protein N-acetyltransferase